MADAPCTEPQVEVAVIRRRTVWKGPVGNGCRAESLADAVEDEGG